MNALSKNSPKQFLNIPAILASLKAFISPSLLIPHISITHLSQLNLTELQKRGVRYIVFDKDNTLCLPFEKDIHPSLHEKIAEVKAKFPGRAAILSNSIGSSDDVNYMAAEACEKALGIPVIRHLKKKPACLAEVLEHFQKMDKLYETTIPCPVAVSQGSICVVGDRVLTDILFANQNGMHSCLVQALTDNLQYTMKQTFAIDNPAAAIVRKLELVVLLPVLRRLGYHAVKAQKPTAGDNIRA